MAFVSVGTIASNSPLKSFFLATSAVYMDFLPDTPFPAILWTSKSLDAGSHKSKY